MPLMLIVWCCNVSFTQQPICAKVKIAIDQELTPEWQTFEARMEINNGQPVQLTDVNAVIPFFDPFSNYYDPNARHIYAANCIGQAVQEIELVLGATWALSKAGALFQSFRRLPKASEAGYVNREILKGEAKVVAKSTPKAHGNRLDAQGPHDVYVIRDANTGQIYHFGETGRGFQKRGLEWVRKLRKEHGLDTIVEHLKTKEGKAAAKELETKYIKTYEKIFGFKPGYTNSTGEFIPVQKSVH